MQNGSFELQVVVSDRSVREFGHQGRTYVEGRKGSRFTLKFRNSSAQRVLAIPSLDGLSAIDGQPATGNSKGYIVPAYSSIEIKGWKTNLRETADFVFTDRTGASYAAQTHGAQNCGVIAVKVFAEKPAPPAPPPPPPPPTVIREEHHHYHYPRSIWPPQIVYGASPTWVGVALPCSTGNIEPLHTCCMESLAASASSTNQVLSLSNAEAPDFSLGTGFGQIREDVMGEAPFDRGLELATIAIYYSDAAALAAVGIELNKVAQISKPLPQAFGGFCRPPAVSS